MKRYSLAFAILALLFIVGGIASANFPKLSPPDTTVSVVLKQGYYNNALVWFFVTDTNDINFASVYLYPYTMPTLAAPLTSAYDPSPRAAVGSKMYINVSKQQGPVFNAVPTQSNYSGIWSVVFVKFLPGKQRIFTNNAMWDAVTNPTGFPIINGVGKQADVLGVYGTSKSGVVVDAPIAAVGPLDNGSWQRSNVDPTTLYRLPQVITFNRYFKLITLPAWYAYCQERFPGSPPASFYIDKCTVIVPDVANPILAARLGANLAPALDLIDSDNAQDFFYIDGRIFGDTPPTDFISGGPPGVLAAINQFPVLEWAPNGRGARNTNRAYTPVMDFVILEGSTNFPFSDTSKKIGFANNWPYIVDFLLPADIYITVPDQRINAPVMDFFRIQPSIGGCPDC